MVKVLNAAGLSTWLFLSLIDDLSSRMRLFERSDFSESFERRSDNVIDAATMIIVMIAVKK